MSRGSLKGRRIAVGVGGGIAAYKVCDLVRELGRAGAQVRVAMTSAAQQFVTPLTFQSLTRNPVLTDYFEPGQEAQFGHLHLAKWAELFLIAPATGDLLARIRSGMANDAVTTSLLAFGGPVLLAPAMNVAMWENAITAGNVRALLSDPRYRMVGPGVGLMADGDTGPGRLAELPQIVDAAAALFGQGPLSGRRILITAGPTREYLDPVRFLSNPSTGKMGLALAQEARARGAEVTVVLGPVPTLEDQDGLEVVPVVSAEEMAAQVLARVEASDVFIATAAVGDYRAEEIAGQKRKKAEGPETLTLVRTPDVLAQASQKVFGAARRPLLVGFAAETERVLEHAREKLVRKRLDFIVANDVTVPGVGFGNSTNQVTVVDRAGAETPFGGTKREVAARLWDLLQPHLPSPEDTSAKSPG